MRMLALNGTVVGVSVSFGCPEPVFGEGPLPSALMVIGEAPGREETRLKKPFVGKAGSFFVGTVSETIGLTREAYYITNAVKFWPRVETLRLKTRTPTGAEAAAFRPILFDEIGIVGPRVIIAVGRTAFQALFKDRIFKPGEWEVFNGIPVMPVYHPAYLLRRLKSIEESTSDLKKALQEVRAMLSAH